MKVAVYLGARDPEVGGGFAFQTSVAEALKGLESRHEYVVIYDRRGRQLAETGPEGASVKYLHGEQATAPAATGPSGEGLLKGVGTRIKKVGCRFRRRYRRSLGLRDRTEIEAERESPLQRLVKEEEFDLIWFASQKYQHVSIPFICTVWDLQHRLQPFFPEVSTAGWTWGQREEHYRFFLPRATKVLTGTHVGKREIAHFYGVAEDNIEVIPFAVPPYLRGRLQEKSSNVRDKYGLKDKYFFYPAQFWPHKNHVNVLLGLKRAIAEHNLDAELVFAGSDRGNQAFVEDEIRRLGLEKTVHILGFVPRSDVLDLYREAQALVFASFFGPDNIPPLEAFALGCPTIAARVNGAQEQLGDAAILVDPARPDEIAMAMVVVSNDVALRRKLKSEGYNRIESLTPAAYVKSVNKIIDRLASIRRCWGGNATYR